MINITLHTTWQYTLSASWSQTPYVWV